VGASCAPVRASLRRFFGGRGRKTASLPSVISAVLISLQIGDFRLYGAAQESNLPSLGLPDLTGFEGLPSDVQLGTEAGFWPRFRPLRSSWVR
jgi:hypothetical protein